MPTSLHGKRDFVKDLEIDRLTLDIQVGSILLQEALKNRKRKKEGQS